MAGGGGVEHDAGEFHGFDVSAGGERARKVDGDDAAVGKANEDGK